MKKLPLLLVTICLFITSFPQEKLASSPNFSVQAILPENQKSKNVSYFDFELMPNSQQTIEIAISSVSAVGEERTYKIEVNNATTNRNGLVDYSEGDREKDSSLKIALSEIVKVVPTVTIPHGETVRVPIQIDMPDEHFEGILLGGITVTEVEDELEDTKQQVTNVFYYNIGLALSQGDVTPPLELNLVGVSKSQENRRSIISGIIQNPTARILRNLSIDASIHRKGQVKPLFYRSETNMAMAPNSNFDFGVGTEDQPLKAGSYTMKVKATAEDEEWEWTKAFEITKEEAKKLNETAVGLEINNTILYIGVAVGLLSALLVIITLLIVTNKRIKKVPMN